MCGPKASEIFADASRNGLIKHIILCGVLIMATLYMRL